MYNNCLRYSNPFRSSPQTSSALQHSTSRSSTQIPALHVLSQAVRGLANLPETQTRQPSTQNLQSSPSSQLSPASPPPATLVHTQPTLPNLHSASPPLQPLPQPMLASLGAPDDRAVEILPSISLSTHDISQESSTHLIQPQSFDNSRVLTPASPVQLHPTSDRTESDAQLLSRMTSEEPDKTGMSKPVSPCQLSQIPSTSAPIPSSSSSQLGAASSKIPSTISAQPTLSTPLPSRFSSHVEPTQAQVNMGLTSHVSPLQQIQHPSIQPQFQASIALTTQASRPPGVQCPSPLAIPQTPNAVPTNTVYQQMQGFVSSSQLAQAVSNAATGIALPPLQNANQFPLGSHSQPTPAATGSKSPMSLPSIPSISSITGSTRILLIISQLII